MNWFHREPTLDKILSDSIVRAVMEADGGRSARTGGDAEAGGLEAGQASAFGLPTKRLKNRPVQYPRARRRVPCGRRSVRKMVVLLSSTRCRVHAREPSISPCHYPIGEGLTSSTV